MRAVDRRILGLAIPALGSLAVEPLYVLVDTAIVGQLGTDQLAGLAIAAGCDFRIVSHQNDRLSVLLGQAHEKIEDQVRIGDIEIPGRFIRKQQ